MKCLTILKKALLLLAMLGGCQWTAPSAHPSGVTEILSDGIVTCEEDATRNQLNACPAARPQVGMDEQGVMWEPDRYFFNLITNPIHAPLDCFRGISRALGESSFQCCYDDDALVEQAGSFDFVNPAISIVQHYLFDVLPFYRCNGNPSAS